MDSERLFLTDTTSKPSPRLTRPRAVLALQLAAGLLAAGLLVTGCANVTGSDPRARTPGTAMDDSAIERIAQRKIKEADPAFEDAHLVIVCDNGILLMAGEVGNETLRAKAQEVIQGISRVRKVHNELTVGPPSAFGTRSNDSWITSKVKSRLTAAPDTDARYVNVTTVSGVVYLMGTVTRAEADRMVAITQQVYGVKKIVKAFEYLD